MSIDCTSTHIMVLTMVYTNFQTLHRSYEHCEIQPKTKAFRRGQRRVRKEARERQHIQNAARLVTLVSTVIKYIYIGINIIIMFMLIHVSMLY